MKSLLTIPAAALLASACVSSYEPVTVKASPRVIANVAKQGYARVILADGRDMEFRPPRDFGDAWCGNAGCVLKKDFVEIEYVSSTPDLGQSLLVAGIGFPVAAVVTGVLIARCDLLCSSNGGTPSPEPPLATEMQRARQWLDGLVIVEGRLTGKMDTANPCTRPYGDRPAPGYATDAEALEAVWQDRFHQSASCVWNASTALRKQAGDVARDRAMRLATLYEVKWRWNTQRCLPHADGWAGQTGRIAPLDDFDLAPQKGDPKALRVIAETLADPQSYTDNAALAECSTAARPEDEWPAIMARVQGLGPFLQ